ncbi:uncharacterized protein [Glycine max]|uniref:uncharacterized protein n=1 Tax=Glycine max TaxID=3847 RepID=UPI0003DEC4C8|nr:uncharacterized protein LOC112998568 [Glycine max]|eukprot:XP_025980468.1 uncharacterized protein LOC112998568 [Glycine max]
MIARWQVQFSEYDIVYVTQKAIKGSALTNYLAHQPVEDYQSMQCEFPDEGIMALFNNKYSSKERRWIMWFDGASNIMGHGVGVVLLSLEKHTVDPLVKGEWETRDAKLIPYQTHIKELVKQFDEVTFDHIPHEDNQLADALATLSSMFALSKDEDMPLIRIQHQD